LLGQELLLDMHYLQLQLLLLLLQNLQYIEHCNLN
jgi:hypothetical protein